MKSTGNCVKRFTIGLICLSTVCLAVTTAAEEEQSPICDSCKLELFAECGEGKFLEGPNFDKNGTLWLVGLRSGEILKAGSGACEVAGRSGGFPGGARISKDGALIVTDRIGLLSYNMNTGAVEELASRYGNENMKGLNDLAIDSSGGIYFTEPYGSNATKTDGRVFYYSPETKAVTLIGDTFAFPNGVMLSPDEKTLYIGDYALNRIVGVPLSGSGEAKTDGVPYVFAYMQGGVGPDGMVTDEDGNLYVAHYKAGEVLVYDRNGFVIETFKMPEDAGMGTTNVALHDGYLYITEAEKNEIWRVAVKTKAHDFMK